MKGFTYKEIVFKHIPSGVDLNSTQIKKKMEYINSCYLHNKKFLQTICEIDSNDRLILERWGKSRFIKMVLSTKKEILRGDILFIDVSFYFDKKKICIRPDCIRKMEKIEEVYKYNKKSFKEYFNQKKINDEIKYVVPCKVYDSKKLTINRKELIVGELHFSDVMYDGYYDLLEVERKRIKEIQNFLRGLTIPQIENTYLSEKSKLKIISLRNKKFLEIPDEIDLSYFIDYRKPKFEKKVNKKIKMLNLDATIKKEYKLPDKELNRVPLGSMTPVKKPRILRTKLKRSKVIKAGNLVPEKIITKVERVLRDTALVNQLKILYNHSCQVCGIKVEVGINQFATEVHHIQPLSKHNGPDIKENMIVLCPNDHVMFDRGAITLDLDSMRVIHINKNNPLHMKKFISKHIIDEKYIVYHNNNIFL